MELPIIIERVIYKNDQGFGILGANLNAYSSKYDPSMEEIVAANVTKRTGYDNFTVTTNMLDPHEKMDGKQYIAVGTFIKHAKYGDQFKSDFMFQDEPKTEDSLRALLMGMPNIKEARSAEIIKKFGMAETLRILDEDPMRLTEINGITEKRVPPIKEMWDREKDKRALYFWLIDHGISPEVGRVVYETWGKESLKILTKNPYQLASDIKGFGFIRADAIAHKIFKNVPMDFRTIACIHYVLKEDLHKNSNLCMPYSRLKQVVMETLVKGSELNNPSEKMGDYLPLIPDCIKKNRDQFVAVKNMEEQTNGAYVYLKYIWDKEKYIAEHVFHRHNKKIDRHEEEKEVCTDKDIEEAEKDIEQFAGRKIVLDDCQKIAIKSAFQNKITVITGGGGSGKSTLCRCIFHLAEEKKMSIRMMSPTGKAAQVLTEKTGFPAATIHRSLKMKPEDDFPKESIREDITIVDEVSMVGIDTMFAIMNALVDNLWGNLILVGDANQLPSVSPGNFLTDLMNSNCVNVVKLDKIHRQDEKSYIAILANDVSQGKVINIPDDATDIKWHDLSTLGEFDIIIRRVVKDFIESNNINDLQILSPMYKGIYGVNKINEVVQDLMAEVNNTKEHFLKKGFQHFYIGDRVIQTENDYKKEIFNGDMGVVTDLGRKALDPDKSDEVKDFVTVNFYGRELKFIDREIEQLKLAWCCTVHKYQGAQNKNIIFVFSQEANIMASKELLYTSMSRAQNRLDVYGHRDVFRIAPTRSVIRKRYTNVNNIIKELRENRKILKVAE